MAYYYKTGVIVPFMQKFYKQLVVVVAGLFIASMATMSLSANAAPVLDSFTQAELNTNWEADRYFPTNGVTSVNAFGRNDVARLGINSASTQPGTFERTEGIKTVRDRNFGTQVNVDLYLDADWDNKAVRAGLWTVGDDGNPATTGIDSRDGFFGIIEFVNNETKVSGISNTTVHEGWRIWNSNTSAWTNISAPYTYGEWVTLSIELDTATNMYHYSIDGVEVGIASAGDNYIREIFLNSYNYGQDVFTNLSTQSYNANWHVGEVADTTNPDAPVVLRMEDSAASTIPHNGTTGSYSVTTLWSTVSDASFYEYSYWNDIVGNPYKAAEASRYIATPVNGTSLSGVFNQGEGVHHVAVRAVDAAGNRSAWSNTYTVTYDVPPVVLGSKEACKKDGWKLSELPVFKNQGDCVSYFATKAKNAPAGTVTPSNARR